MEENKSNSSSSDRSGSIRLTPSADGILDVTPVSTFEDERYEDAYDSGNTANHRPTTSLHSGTFSSARASTSRTRTEDDDEEGDQDDSDGTEDEDDENAETEHESEDEDDGEADHTKDGESSASGSTSQYNPSEWDKVLRSGRSSMGKAADFFQATVSSYDSSDVFPSPKARTDDSAFGGDSVDDAKKRQLKIQATTSAGTPTSMQSPSNKSTAAPHRVSSAASTASAANATLISVHNNARSSPQHQQHQKQQQQQLQTTKITPIPSSLSWNNSLSTDTTMRPHPADDHLSSGVLPDVLMTMRLNLESLALFDSDMMRIAADQDADPFMAESRESLKRSSQQSISAAVLVSLAHKRYERRRLAAMEIEKVVRSLVHQNEIERVRAILLLLSDDYVRSTNEDARKGGVVALAACAIGLKKANDSDTAVLECRDLILASVVHACQDHSQRVRYYATESLFNVVKVIPTMAVQHFFILFEILRSLYADVDVDVRSGAELLDRKLKEVIVGAMNSGTFTAEDCIPVFARFVHMRNKATKRLTLTWLQELNEKLVAAPILEFLHLFLGGIFDMIADPTQVIRQSALAFLHSVLPKLLAFNVDTEEKGEASKTAKVDFDKILQSLVTTMEHPDPFVRKVAMYWMSRIVKAHVGESETKTEPTVSDGSLSQQEKKTEASFETMSSASQSVRNSLPHILPGILLSIGDDFYPRGTTKDSFLPDQTTRALAEQTNATLQNAVRRDGQTYVPHLDAFIVALREELDSPGGLNARYPTATERSPYRMDVNQDGTGIESAGWFSASGEGIERTGESMVMSRLCALDWVIVLYESVVPVLLKADYALEFVFAIIHQLVDNPPETIVFKSLEVLARITVAVPGEDVGRSLSSNSMSGLAHPAWLGYDWMTGDLVSEFPMNDQSISFAFDILEPHRRRMMSRNREVFSALVQLYSYNQDLLDSLSKVITYMCKLQPPEFVFVAFAVELDRFVRRREAATVRDKKYPRSHFSRDLKFASSFIQNMSHVLLTAAEAKPIRDVLKDCVCTPSNTERGRQKTRLFRILLHSFSHNLATTVSLCFWAGAYRTTTKFLSEINPLDINLMFLLEIDRFIELLERPLFRHLHVRMVERDKDPHREGSGSMLFQALKSLLMMLPQSTCYSVLRDRLTSVSRFRQSAIGAVPFTKHTSKQSNTEADAYVNQIKHVRELHCTAAWRAIRAESLAEPPEEIFEVEEGASRRDWLGFSSKEEDKTAQDKYREGKRSLGTCVRIEEIRNEYHEFPVLDGKPVVVEEPRENAAKDIQTVIPLEDKESTDGARWKGYWMNDQ